MSLNGFHEDKTIRILVVTYYGRSHGGRVLFNMLLACLSLLYDHSLMLTASFGDPAVSDTTGVMVGRVKNEGEVSLSGDRTDEGDTNDVPTALGEVEEENGLNLA
nr:hypothetical protein [Tanacetum cinerariifolium]